MEVLQGIAIELRDAAASAGPALVTARDASAAARTQKTAIRALTAKFVSVGFLIHVGKETLRGMLLDVLPDTARRGVNISEMFRLFYPEPDAALQLPTESRTELATDWAEGHFGGKAEDGTELAGVSIKDALSTVSAAGDVLKGVERAVLKALKGGETPEAIFDKVEEIIQAHLEEVAARQAAEEVNAERQAATA